MLDGRRPDVSQTVTPPRAPGGANNHDHHHHYDDIVYHILILVVTFTQILTTTYSSFSGIKKSFEYVAKLKVSNFKSF